MNYKDFIKTKLKDEIDLDPALTQSYDLCLLLAYHNYIILPSTVPDVLKRLMEENHIDKIDLSPPNTSPFSIILQGLRNRLNLGSKKIEDDKQAIIFNAYVSSFDFDMRVIRRKDAFYIRLSRVIDNKSIPIFTYSFDYNKLSMRIKLPDTVEELKRMLEIDQDPSSTQEG